MLSSKSVSTSKNSVWNINETFNSMVAFFKVYEMLFLTLLVKLIGNNPTHLETLNTRVIIEHWSVSITFCHADFFISLIFLVLMEYCNILKCNPFANESHKSHGRSGWKARGFIIAYIYGPETNVSHRIYLCCYMA